PLKSSVKPAARKKRKRKTHAQVANDVAEAIDPAAFRIFGMRLRKWYRQNARDLPWRKTRDPYRVLVSELMLQQTQVSRVIDFYDAFLTRFPTLNHVAESPVSHIEDQWEGLGYYARARNLHALSRVVMTSDMYAGALPSDPAALRELPGIGAYTAGAVSSFAYEKRAPLVDTNVARVLLRVFAPRFAPKSAAGQKVAWALAEASLPRTGRDTWTHNQALMELGALTCRAQIRLCSGCPAATACESVISVP
ncbi:MAG: A/G-specific adenine glycosylase, partial [Gemmatimonadaceae bacterium]